MCSNPEKYRETAAKESCEPVIYCVMNRIRFFDLGEVCIYHKRDENILILLTFVFTDSNDTYTNPSRQY
jgi:hypothetical protein